MDSNHPSPIRSDRPEELRPPQPDAAPESAGPSRVGATWTAVGVALILLVLLVIFILQNGNRVQVKFLWAEGSVPLGIALLVTAVGSGVVVGLAAAARVVELQRRVRRARKARH